MSKRALVTGGTGFIGSHLVNQLLENSWEIGLTIRSSSSVDSRLREQCTLIATDAAPETFTEAVQRFSPDTCFHLATKFVGVHKPDDIRPMIQANVEFGTLLLDALSALPTVSFVNVGTIWQHHDAREYSPSSLYAATKEAFTDIVQFYAECTNIKAITLELSDSYGPNDPRKKLLQLLIGATNAGEALQMSPGEQLVDFTHVKDIVQALLHAVTLADDSAPRYGLHGNGMMPLKQFTDLVSKILDTEVPIVWGAREYRPREMMKSWRFTPPLPGWEPTISLEDGLREVLTTDH